MYIVGIDVGLDVGVWVSPFRVGLDEAGIPVGTVVGNDEGTDVGILVGIFDGSPVGWLVGSPIIYNINDNKHMKINIILSLNKSNL